MHNEEKARESRVRRLAASFDLALVKSRRRNPEVPDYGCFAVVDPYRNAIVYGVWGGGFAASLDEVEEWLRTD